MIFITEKRPDLHIYSPGKGVDIWFENGRYETTDPAEIAVLRRNRYVTDFSEVERDLATPSPLDDPLGLHGSTGPFNVSGEGEVPPAGLDDDQNEDGGDEDQPPDY